MLNIILFDTEARNNLLPLTATRPICELRIGALTIREKWEHRFKTFASYITQEYLAGKYPFRAEEENLIIAGNVLPTDALCRKIEQLNMNEALLFNGELIAARLDEVQMEALIGEEAIHEIQSIELPADTAFVEVNDLWDLLSLNASALQDDFITLTQNRKSQPLSSTNRVVGSHPIYLESGAKVECCIFNTNDGPIYIGKNAQVMEGSILRGPIAICENAIVKAGAKIYGPSTIGPGCRVGGEVTRSILSANSNKAHDGYLGDSVLGEWCNLGADTNNSNLKNNYSAVKLWSYHQEKFVSTGQQFCGLFMGDHSKCGINTMFNTGTVVGVFANVYGAGYQRNFVPDFSWGGTDSSMRTYQFQDACKTAELVMSRRNIAFHEYEKAMLYHIYDRTAKYRSWEK
jgi:UDP-N-acetylglucosamine diphosphorylase/glucosamine-1-phosphate N-acetyltransferase